MSNTRTFALLGVAAAIIVGMVFLFSDFGGKDTGTAAPRHTSATPSTVTTTTVTSPAVVDVSSNPDTDAAEDTVRQALSVAFTWYPATDSSPHRCLCTRTEVVHRAPWPPRCSSTSMPGVAPPAHNGVSGRRTTQKLSLT